MAAVTVEGLRKRYGKIEAVRDVSFEVEEGAIFALLGPNGAGKTTTVEVLEGFRERDAGHVDVLGFDPAERSTSRTLRERMGIVLQELAVEPTLSVREALTRNAGFYPAPRSVDDVIEIVGLAEKADARIKTLSGGQQRRLDLGLGIVGDPDVLFLDEPTTGFDPTARHAAWDVVRSLTGGGATVILTTHYMDEAEALADSVAIVVGGAIVARGAPESLGGRDSAEAHIRFHVPSTVASSDLPVSPTRFDRGAVEISTDDEVKVLHELTGWAIERQITLTGLSVERLSLEDIYLRLAADHPEAVETETGLAR